MQNDVVTYYKKEKQNKNLPLTIRCTSNLDNFVIRNVLVLFYHLDCISHLRRDDLIHLHNKHPSYAYPDRMFSNTESIDRDKYINKKFSDYNFQPFILITEFHSPYFQLKTLHGPSHLSTSGGGLGRCMQELLRMGKGSRYPVIS